MASGDGTQGDAEGSTPFAADAREVAVRDFYAKSLRRVRRSESLVRREQGYVESGLRADMRTVDEANVLREWEFKLHADYRALGQILTYVALARRELGWRPIRGVIAAFTFAEEVRLANEIMNLNLELVTIPEWMRAAGGVPQRMEGTLHLPIRHVARVPTS